jgi:hypothetical protein
MAWKSRQIVIVSLAVVLASCSKPYGVQVLLENSNGTGDNGAGDWERFSRIVEAPATTASLTPQQDVTDGVCRSWSTDKTGSRDVAIDGIILNACRERDFKGTHYPTGAIASWNYNWWNPVAVSRAKTMSSKLISAMHAEFGDRIKVRQ